MPRILSKDGNVIAADFGQRGGITIEFKTEILYCDAAVCLVRITYLHGGKCAGVQHLLAEMPAI